jgi:hypothetical protein
VAQGVGPEFKPQYHTHTKKKSARGSGAHLISQALRMQRSQFNAHPSKRPRPYLKKKKKN